MRKKDIYYEIDSCMEDSGQLVCSGWAFSKNGLIKISNNQLFNIVQVERKDIVDFYSDQKVPLFCGFKLYFSLESSNFVIKLDDSKDYVYIDVKKYIQRRQLFYYIKSKLNIVAMKNLIKIFMHDGILGVIRKTRISYTQSKKIPYQKWYFDHRATYEELEQQKKIKFSYSPLISIITPTFNTPEKFLIDMVHSIQLQTYKNWELCIADGSTNPKIFHILQEMALEDSRIKVKKVNNKGISGNSNEALNLAKGDYIGLVDHDDLLTPDALYEIVKKINENIDIDLIYSDEDKIDTAGKNFFSPYFKSDFSIDLLRSNNYICHFLVIKSALLENVGKCFYSEFDGAQDYDLILRCVERASYICHIPKVLYHWRMHSKSTAATSKNKLYTHVAGKKAIIQHLGRLGIDAEVLDNPQNICNAYKVKYTLKSEDFISIIIPTCDHIEDLIKCLQSIKRTINYEKYEILIVENNSKEKETFEYYEHLRNENNIRILKYPFEFNYSAINNWAMKQAKGDYAVLINNDVEIIAFDWVREMLSYCQREDVGIVGAKLYYPDNTIQHAGVIIGIGGVASHAFRGFSQHDFGYFGRAVFVQDLSAVTAAFLMIKKSVFYDVKGFDESLAVAFNDVDLCLKVRRANLLVVFDPDVTAYHYESKSRGNEDTPEKKKRFLHEHEIFYNKWGKNFIDPYYNINLTLDKEDFSLKNY